MSHTPGPWVYEKFQPVGPNGKPLPCDPAFEIRGDWRNSSEAGEPGQPVIGEVDSDEADARLIAAAPRLLEALRDLLDEVHHQRSLGDFAAKLSVRERGHDAIAEATGEAS